MTAAYPQRQTRPAERKITKKYNDDSSLLRYCVVSTGEETPVIRSGRRAGSRSSWAISLGEYVENAYTAFRYLSPRT